MNLERLVLTEGAALIGGLEALSGVWDDVFGGVRATGWFSTKLHRECVSAPRCVLAFQGGSRDAEAITGFVLAGAPPSLQGLVRTAGVGVRAHARRRGLGTLMLKELFTRARREGARAIQTVATESRVDWYLGLGYRPRRWQLHAASFGRADGLTSPTEQESSPFVVPAAQYPAQASSPWLPEAWLRTPVERRFEFHAGPGRLGISREPGGLLVHWSEPADALLVLADDLRRHTPAAQRIILYGVRDEPSVRRALDATAWTIVQRSAVLRRELDLRL